MRRAIAFGLLVATASCGAPASSGGLKPQTAAAIVEALAPVSEVEGPGFAMAVMVDGQLALEIVSGAADVEQGSLITRDTVFHIASLSKQITAAALAKAILERGVSLEDPVSKHVPEVGKYGDELKIVHLVYMTSGLIEYYDVDRPGGAPWDTHHYFTIDDAIQASLSAEALAFEPGSEWRYSNINYMLLTRIVGKAYEKPFSDVVNEELFAPLGMASSLVNDDTTAIVPKRANAYTVRSREAVAELRSTGLNVRDGEGLILIRRNSPHYGGSGVMTSLADWESWSRELLTHEKLGEDFWTLMFARRRFDHRKDNDAFGLVFGERQGREMIWYSGGDIDASSFAAYFRGKRAAIICFANDPMANCEAKALGVIDLLIDNGEI